MGLQGPQQLEGLSYLAHLGVWEILGQQPQILIGSHHSKGHSPSLCQVLADPRIQIAV